MKTLIVIVTLLHILVSPASSADDELTLLSSKIKFYLQEKGWRLEDQLVRYDVAYHHWRNKDRYVKLSFFYCKTEEAAAERLQDDSKDIRAEFGSGGKAQAIGDEAYEWEGIKGGQALVNFRRGRVIVAVTTSSIAEAKDCAQVIASLLRPGVVAKVATSQEPALEPREQGSYITFSAL
jgi:hypothetical protein